MSGVMGVVLITMTWMMQGGQAAWAEVHDTNVARDPLLVEQAALEILSQYLVLQDQQQALVARQSKALSEEQTDRYLYGAATGSGFQVSQRDMRVSRVIQNSPAQQAGLQSGDIIVGVNGVRGNKSAMQRAQLIMAYRRLNPGQQSFITVLRDQEEHELVVPVLTQEALREIRHSNWARQQTSGTLEDHRQDAITRNHYDQLYPLVEGDHLGAWDGLVLMTLHQGLAQHVYPGSGVLVLSCEDHDHPLQPGDVITRVGQQTPADARHAVRLLYDHDQQASVPLAVTRKGHWLQFEMDYPSSEVLSR